MLLSITWCPQHRRSSAEARPGLGPQEDDRRESYYVGACRHRVTAKAGADGLLFRIGACRECDEEPQ